MFGQSTRPASPQSRKMFDLILRPLHPLHRPIVRSALARMVWALDAGVDQPVRTLTAGAHYFAAVVALAHSTG